jgi:hypothetical protein
MSRQYLYASAWTPYNASDDSNPRSFAYWADLGVSDMILWTGMPGQNNGGPAEYSPLLGASEGDAKFVAAQANRRGIQMHIGCEMHGYYGSGTQRPAHPAPFNGASPQRDWLTDDAYWNGTILVGAHTMAKRAKVCGYTGVFYDEEISSNNDGWTYAGYKAAFPTSTLTNDQANTAAFNRGRSWMQAHIAEFPNIEYTNYSASSWPRGWSNFLRTKNNPIYTPSLQNYFYKGALSVPGYKHVWFLNADFYGGQYFPTHPYTYDGKTYDRWQWGTVQFDRDQTKKFWDTFLDPATDRTKVDIVPFIAIPQIEGGQYEQYKTKTVSMVTEQIVPSILQTINPNERPVPLFGHYCYSDSADKFDFAPYRDALRKATTTTTAPPPIVTPPPVVTPPVEPPPVVTPPPVGSIVVKDANGNVVPGATVTIKT